jgi:hypothetical protein
MAASPGRRHTHAAAPAAGAEYAGGAGAARAVLAAATDTAFDAETGALKSPARLHALVLELANTAAALKPT